MKTIIIHQFPTLADFFFDVKNVSLMHCLRPMLNVWNFTLTTEWKFINDKLQISLSIENHSINSVDEDTIIASIESMLNLYQYGFTKLEGPIDSYQSNNTQKSITKYSHKPSTTLSFLSNSNNSNIIKEGFELIPSEINSGILTANQLFSILSYLRHSKGILKSEISFKLNAIHLIYIKLLSNSGISPWGIIDGFELSSRTSPISNNHASRKIPDVIANKLLSIPIAYPGIINTIYGYNNQASVVSEPGENGDVVVGRIHNSPMGEKLTLRPKDFSYMTAVWGVPGQGKSVLSLSLIIQLWKNKIPTLVIEPSKHEYRALANIFPEDVKVVNNMSDFNILMPPKGIDYLSWSEVVMNLLNIACQLPEDSSLTGYYRKSYLLNSEQKKFPNPHITPRNMLKCYEHIMEKEKFGAHNKDFVTAGRSRLEAFFTYFNNKKRKGDDLKTFDIESLLQTPVIIELSSISTPKMKSAWVYFILQHLYAYIQQRQSQADTLRNLLVLEEAHNILRSNMNPDVLSNVANILAEARALQLGVLISDQSPKTLEPSCISMAQNVFSFKIVDEEDRQIISASTNCDPMKLINMQKRNCLVRTNFMNETNCVEVISNYAKDISAPVQLHNNIFI